MVKKSDIELLFNKIRNIPTTPGNGTLIGVSKENGESTMKLKVVRLIQDWYSSLNLNKTNGGVK